ncbi:chemotaxis protein CheV [Ferrimonas marina]|uniref:Two-component system, chemotaxis family, response regulator CheV n=1 Tax=Ferrimonas marina TaxID=299255 RepID=A0A1M5YAZ3_9GAMM|nr:chemotaxis protein CheV [Ferrimonas marina]SHI09250.1 two-component system, chemotaxis family, response regulator CheV [Ferrimonas marina]
MASILDSVNQRTQLVGQNRLELLLFRLRGRQRYGINVFKVREVLQCPKLTAMPHQKSVICGVAHIRGQAISVIDLSAAIGGPTTPVENSFIIITEYNRKVQGFLVAGVDRIVNLNWETVLPPPQGSGRSNYLTAVTELDDQLVEILDVEKILDEINPAKTEVSEQVASTLAPVAERKRTILVADDSAVARKQVQRALEPLGLEILLAKDGVEALQMLQALADECQSDIAERMHLVISDIEMPEMDGYTLTAEIRANAKLKSLRVILHTSLSGVFNQAMVDKVGADQFIAKFNPDDLASTVNNILEQQ